jgi:hypothetical protein
MKRHRETKSALVPGVAARLVGQKALYYPFVRQGGFVIRWDLRSFTSRYSAQKAARTLAAVIEHERE